MARSWLGSGVLHAIVVAGLLAAELWFGLSRATERPVRGETIRIVGRAEWDAGDPDEPGASEPRPVRLVEPPNGEDDLQPGPLDANRVGRAVDRAIDAARALTPDEQLERLRRHSDELRRASSAESIDQLATSLGKWLGTAPRAMEPDETVGEGPFDFATAQLHDVRREPLDAGGFRYHTVLVDAAGRRFETEVDAATGESLYRVFEIIRGNPLLEKVYRQIVMGLLDKLEPGRSPGSSRTGP